nr:hypothetical protein [uncultured Albidiferax sp.]
MPHYPASYGRDVASQRASAGSALLGTVRWSFRSFAPSHRGTRTVLVDADETRAHRAAATPVRHGWQPTGGGIGRLIAM